MRDLFGRLVLAAGVVASAMLLLVGPASAGTTITVNSGMDVVDGSDGRCTLREAVTSANTNVSSGAIAGECSAGVSGSPDVIQFSAGGTINLFLGQLTLAEDVEVDGKGAVTVSGQGSSRVFEVNNAANATLRGVVIRDGDTTGNGGGVLVSSSAAVRMEDSVIEGNTATGDGGGVAVDGASVTIINSIVDANTGMTGGVHIVDSTVMSTISDSVISNNVGAPGGEIDNGAGVAIGGAGQLTMERTEVSGNTTSSGNTAGAIALSSVLDSAFLIVLDSTISGNSNSGATGVRTAGVQHSFGGTVTISGSTFVDNTGIRVIEVGPGMSIVNSTISGNTANNAISIGDDDDLTLLFSTVTANTGGGLNMFGDPAVTVGASVVAGNSGTDIFTIPNFNGVFVSEGFNVVGVVVDVTPGNVATPSAVGDVVGVVDPLLGPLADNGGSTDTHALLAGSPAIDRVTGVVSEDEVVDQRGEVRPMGVAKDSGAFEASVSSAMCNGLLVDVNIASGGVPTSGDDVILGTSGADVIDGLGGDDTICGEGGDDMILTGDGDDWVDGGPGADTILGQDGDDIIFGGGGGDLISGNAGNDVLHGEGGGDDVFGGSGDDTITGGVGNDTLGGSSDRDVITGEDGNDTISGGSDSDGLISGGEGDDAVNGGGGGDDNVRGDGGDDTVSGNGGSDAIFGGDGDDEVRGGQGNDIVNGGAGDDFVAGNEGVDTCDGGTTGETAGDSAALNCETIINVP